ncbi:PaaI family thioesterase [Pontixanthobacter aestiaquae]|uniref:PaaI family thioesterase n=1 Tax=Pontixanthobacter aestiaquae TaxID=1509367 RepID=A0A844ZA28_9SPHN|nr:PaaI family thioesterase [Pontixanthobacter aestiaquae]MDN3645288.1 PaaI family thioesterase [Pontixanthobacter aestiaquae]MXO83710.1 PaaI family thioesterase [Pontixanthobacter aestiaquae]
MREPPDFFTYEPVPDQPGWYTWDMADNSRFNTQVMGPMMVRHEGDKCRLRMFPEHKHTNLQDMIHGATTLSLIDISLFSAMHVLRKSEAGMAVTLELSTQFIGGGKPDEPMDAVVEVMRETGRLMFMRGEVMQGDHLVAAYSGLVRKASPKT